MAVPPESRFTVDRVHWASYAGKNFTDCQRIKRKAANWGRRYQELPRAERVAVLAAMMAIEAQELPGSQSQMRTIFGSA